MIKKIKTYTHLGLQGFEIEVEVDSNNSIPSIEIIGLPDAAIKESKERIRSTFRNVGIFLPPKKFVLNLAPSDLKKIWTSFDLPMAVAILLLMYEDVVHSCDFLDNSLFFGELGLDWSVKPVTGILPCVVDAMHHGYKHFFVPVDNLYELEYVPGINIYPINHFGELLDYFLSWKALKIINEPKNIEELYKTNQNNLGVDFVNIKWHLMAKRALSIAAAGGHNIMMIWAPGSGKTLLSKALQTILPPLWFEEILEVSQIYSVVWKLNRDTPLITIRPFRQIHHTASKISIVWWGSALTPGEISLAHKWILFFDELTEFPREVLEVLRQPLEDKMITISRVAGSIQYPANFMFVASMNPCKCWYYKDREKACICSLLEVKKYQSKISGPMLDRIDMILEIPREVVSTVLDGEKWESSEIIRERVVKAWRIQQERFAGSGLVANAHMLPKHLEQFVVLSQECKDFLIHAATKLTFSTRVVHRIIKLARTIADMNWVENICINDLAEAMQYRNKTFFVEQE